MRRNTIPTETENDELAVASTNNTYVSHTIELAAHARAHASLYSLAEKVHRGSPIESARDLAGNFLRSQNKTRSYD